MLEKIVWWIEATWGRLSLYRKTKKTDNIKNRLAAKRAYFLCLFLFHTH